MRRTKANRVKKRDPEKTSEARNKRAALKGLEHIRGCIESGKFIRQWWLREWLETLQKYHEDCETVHNSRCSGTGRGE